MMKYKALVVRETDEGFRRQVEVVDRDFLPSEGVLIRVEYAALNYKDALSASGHRGVTKNYPHTPGVDAAGTVVEGGGEEFAPGTPVIVTSYDLGMNTKGAFAEYIRVPSSWIVLLPEGLTLRESMILGTAGFTAALAIHKMEVCGQSPEDGEVVVSGASGGVGSMAVALLAQKGYEVVASSGKPEYYDWLSDLGAERCINREELIDTSGRPLVRSRWAGAIDTVGGETLTTLLKACAPNGNVASCGLVGSAELNTTVYPFILNGVNLLGVDSAETPMALRRRIWSRLGGELKPPMLEEMAEIVRLEDIPRMMDDILNGETWGRIVARLKDE